jgi:hypothetical protein
MTAADYFDLAVRCCSIGVVGYILVGQVIKPGLRLIARWRSTDGKLSRAQEGFFRWLTRALAVMLGAALGCLPLWPDWLLPAWGPLLGCLGGGLSPGIYAATKKALPAAVARVLNGKGIRDQ